MFYARTLSVKQHTEETRYSNQCLELHLQVFIEKERVKELWKVRRSEL